MPPLNTPREHLTPEEADARSIARSRANQRRERKHMLTLWAASVLMFMALAWVLQNQINENDRFLHEQCEMRKANTTKTNSNWDRLAEIERNNRFIDEDLRKQRLDMYRDAHLVIPNC